MSNQVEYRDIPDAPGYRVGSDGSVWSRRIAPRGMSNDWHQLKPVQQSTGYVTVKLGHRAQVKGIHRLVLEAFVGPCPPGKLAAHRNGIRNDNRLENLRWATPQENEHDKEKHGTKLVGVNLPWTKLNDEKVAEIRTRSRQGESDMSLAARFGVSRAAIHSLRTGKSWRHVA